jgi:hypothetical protein
VVVQGSGQGGVSEPFSDEISQSLLKKNTVGSLIYAAPEPILGAMSVVSLGNTTTHAKHAIYCFICIKVVDLRRPGSLGRNGRVPLKQVDSIFFLENIGAYPS